MSIVIAFIAQLWTKPQSKTTTISFISSKSSRIQLIPINAIFLRDGAESEYLGSKLWKVLSILILLSITTMPNLKINMIRETIDRFSLAIKMRMIKSRMIKSSMRLKNKKILVSKTIKRHLSKASTLSQLRSWFNSSLIWTWWPSKWWKSATMSPKCLWENSPKIT